MADPDVLIVGGGVAGLAAAIDLARAGLHVEILEARERVGGRVSTRHDAALNHPVELGAEFVHGLAPEIWVPVQKHNLAMTEVEGDFWCSTNGKLEPCGFFGEVEKILAQMDDESPDESFLSFLDRRFPDLKDEEVVRRAIGYVRGFNAADPGQVSVHWLAHERDAGEQLQGDRAFHIVGGYSQFVKLLEDETAAVNAVVHLNTVVRLVEWQPGTVKIEARSAHGDETFAASRVLITLPLGVLQESVGQDQAAGDHKVHFSPGLPGDKLIALNKLVMGKVVRVALCFHKPLWAEVSAGGKTLAEMSFLFSGDDLFPVWWTQMPDPAPIITGWAPASSAENLSGMSEGRVIDKAVESLAVQLGISKLQVSSGLVNAYFHDWTADPFSRGAYSYVKAGGEGCQKILGAPLGNTLFFAGEATDSSGNNGTVHGAIASGQRAAREIIGSK